MEENIIVHSFINRDTKSSRFTQNSANLSNASLMSWGHPRFLTNWSVWSIYLQPMPPFNKRKIPNFPMILLLPGEHVPFTSICLLWLFIWKAMNFFLLKT